MAAIGAWDLDVLVDDVAANDREAFQSRLEELKGIGAMCSLIAWILMAKESIQ